MVKKLLYILVFLYSALLSATEVPANIEAQYNYLMARNASIENSTKATKSPWYIILKDGNLSDLKNLISSIDKDYEHLTIKSGLLGINESQAKQVNTYLTTINAKNLLELYVALEDGEPMVVPLAPINGTYREQELKDYYRKFLDSSATMDGYDPGIIEQQIAARFKHDDSLLENYQNSLSSDKDYKILLVESLSLFKSKKGVAWKLSSILSYTNKGKKTIDGQELSDFVKVDNETYHADNAINKLLKYSSNFYMVVYGESPVVEGLNNQYNFDLKEISIGETITKSTPNDKDLLPKKELQIYDFAGIFTSEEYAEINEQLNELPLNPHTNVYAYYTDNTVSTDIIAKIEDTPNKNNTVALWLHLEDNGTVSSKLLMSKELEQQYAFLKVWRQMTPYEKMEYRGKDALRAFGTGFAEFGAAIGELIRMASIPEDFYNRCHPNFEEKYGSFYTAIEELYAYSKSNDKIVSYTRQTLRPFVEQLLQLPEVNLGFCNFDINNDADVLWVSIAFTTGIYNEAINVLAGVPESFSLVNFLVNPDINMGEEFTKFFSALNYEKIWNLAGTSLEEAFPSDNVYVIAYSSGRTTLFVASFAVAFTKTGKLSKVGQTFEALDGMNALSIMFKAIGVGSKYTLKVVGGTSKKIYQLVSKTGGETLVRLLQKADNTGYDIAITTNSLTHTIGNVDELGNVRITNKLNDGEVVETLQNITYLDNGIETTGDLTIVRNGDEVGVKVVKGGGDFSHFLDDAFVLSKRAEVIAERLPAQFPNLSIDELTAIKVYTSDEVRNGVKIYKSLNTQLRAGSLDDYYQGLNQLLNDGLSKLSKHNGNTVFRGIHGDEVTIADGWKKGDLVDFKDFKSSSTSIETAAYEFSYKQGYDVVLEIKNADGYNICNISCSPSEMEILLSSGQKFEVIDIVDNFQIYDPSYTQQNPFTKIILEIAP
ncbi:ADP-ribosyltransferase domain-containing protein [Joostella sp.]|uniref:ADP-ribosyltransferase domain-containing protein n=1 Tax=Joostella sp. TaxID=2231138 RepID=UPI003A92443F